MEEEYVINIDHREPEALKMAMQEIILAPPRGKTFYKIGAMKTIEMELPIGDIEHPYVLIERKQVDDFFASIKDGRAEEQREKMSTVEDRVLVLVVEGDKSKFPLPQQKGFISTEAKFALSHISIVSTEDTYQTAYFALQIIARSIPEETKEVFIKPLQKVQGGGPPQLRSLLAIDGIGPKHAAMLVSAFNSIEEICNASVESLKKIIGPARGALVYQFFHTKVI